MVTVTTGKKSGKIIGKIVPHEIEGEELEWQTLLK